MARKLKASTPKMSNQKVKETEQPAKTESVTKSTKQYLEPMRAYEMFRDQFVGIA